MKKTLLILSALAIFSLAPHALAQGFVPLTNIPGLTNGATATTAGLATFLNNLYKYLIGIAAILAVIEIIWGGIELSNQDSVSMHSDGVERIQQAVLGLVLVLSPVLVFTIINPSILNLSLNLPPINLVAGNSASTATNNGGTGGNQTAPTSGCNASATNNYLVTANCATQADANNFSCPNGLSTNVYCGTQTGSGSCASGNTVACEASVTLRYYLNTYAGGLLPGTSGQVTPGSAAAQQAFTSGCNANGGTVDLSTTASGALSIFLRTSSLGALFGLNGCTSADNVTFNTNSQSGVLCYDDKLTCVPPGQ